MNARSSDSKRCTSSTGDVVDVAPDAGVDHDNLFLDWQRDVQPLLQQFGEAIAAVKLSLRGLVELGAERRERLELAELGEVDLERPDDGLHRLDLGRAPDTGHRVADVHRRPHTGVEQVGLEEDLTVGDRDDVRRDVGGDVARLGLDDRQGRERAAADLVGELRRPLQQTAVEIEDVPGVGLPTGRAAKEEGELAVGLGLFREVVVDDERVLAVLHPVLADAHTRRRGRGT